MRINKMQLNIQACLDSHEMAQRRKNELLIDRKHAAELNLSARNAAKNGFYLNEDGKQVSWHKLVQTAVNSTTSIKPDADLPTISRHHFTATKLQVSNITTLAAAEQLSKAGLRPLALNFANGITAGGGFLHDSRAQEEVLCRSSALYQTLLNDPMYKHHKKSPHPGFSDWAIYSPNVPVFRQDNGSALPPPWQLSFISCPAPYARSPLMGSREAAALLALRINRILNIAKSYAYSSLVLGAWGCGDFGNDPLQTAHSFRRALETDFKGDFSHIIFAITDWSENRKFLGPFRDVFNPQNHARIYGDKQCSI